MSFARLHPGNSPTDLESRLMRSFVEGVDWPPDAASLAALSDLGLSQDEIADYFSVAPAEVRLLR